MDWHDKHIELNTVKRNAALEIGDDKLVREHNFEIKNYIELKKQHNKGN